jgi:cardiolipin synthase
VCDIKFYTPPKLSLIYKPATIFPRNHKKIIIIDNDMIFIGGICISNEIKLWRDTMLEVHDKTIADKARYFLEGNWHKKQAQHAHYNKASDEFDPKNDLLIHNPDYYKNTLYQKICDKIKNASTVITICTLYFSIHSQLIDLLCDTAPKGVKINLLLSDYSKYSAYVVGKLQIGKLIQRGVQVYYFKPEMFHLKSIIIDNQWCGIGSFNFDSLSIFHNEEIMLISSSSTLISKLDLHIKDDIKKSIPYCYEKWGERSMIEKIMGYVIYPFRHYL